MPVLASSPSGHGSVSTTGLRGIEPTDYGTSRPENDPSPPGRSCSAIVVTMIAAIVTAGTTACSGRAILRPYPEPRAEQVVTHLESIRQRVTVLRAETVSDARVGRERAKVTVFILAAWGGKLRFMAMSPAGGMAADLASDGRTYCYLDANANCGECGDATAANVAKLIRIELPPDEVVAMLVGSTPLLDAKNTTLSWDARNGHEILSLSDGQLEQRIVLDGREHRWDVLDSTMRDQGGRTIWRIRHKNFHEVTGADGMIVRLPGRSFFEQEGDSVLIEWKQQEVNIPVGEERFQLSVPSGLQPCSQERQ
ncbi:MAG: DUF4292 domain-containing protein [Pseudomonadota bacterium]